MGKYWKQTIEYFIQDNNVIKGQKCNPVDRAFKHSKNHLNDFKTGSSY